MISQVDLERMSWPARRKHDQRMKERLKRTYKHLNFSGDLHAVTKAIVEARADLIGLARIKRCEGCGGWLYIAENDLRTKTEPKPCATCMMQYRNH